MDPDAGRPPEAPGQPYQRTRSLVIMLFSIQLERLLCIARSAGFLLVHTAGSRQSKQQGAERLAHWLGAELHVNDSHLAGIAEALARNSWDLSPGDCFPFIEGGSQTRHALVPDGVRLSTRAEEALSVAYAAGLVARDPKDNEALGLALLHANVPRAAEICEVEPEIVTPVIGVIAWLKGHRPVATFHRAARQPRALPQEDDTRGTHYRRAPYAFELNGPTKFSGSDIQRIKARAMRWLIGLGCLRWWSAVLAIGIVPLVAQHLAPAGEPLRSLVSGAVGLCLFMALGFVLSQRMEAWRQRLHAVSPLAPLLYDQALALADQHIHLECYRRTVVAHREFTNGDFAAMQAFAEHAHASATRLGAIDDFVAVRERRQAAFRALHAVA